MLIQSTVDKIKLTLEQELSEKIISLVPLTSKFGMKRFSNKRTFLVKCFKKRYVAYITSQNKAFEYKQVHINGLQNYFPKIIFSKDIKNERNYRITLYEFIEGRHLSDIFLDSQISKKIKIQYFKKTVLYILKKNRLIGIEGSREDLSKELYTVFKAYKEKFIINYSFLSKIKKEFTNLATEMPKVLLIKRDVNFDLIPSNVLIKKNGSIKFVDLEIIKTSNLHLMEPIRFLYYISYQDFINNRKNDERLTPFSFEYNYLSLTSVTSPLYDYIDIFLKAYRIDYKLYTKLLLLLLLEENLLFEKVYNKIINYEFIFNNEKDINYFLSNNPGKDLLLEQYCMNFDSIKYHLKQIIKRVLPLKMVSFLKKIKGIYY